MDAPARRSPARRSPADRSPARLRALLLVLAAFVWGGAAEAAGTFRTLQFEGLRIVIDSEWGEQLAPGYVPVRFDILNEGEARVVRVVGEGSRYLAMGYIAGYVPPSRTVMPTASVTRVPPRGRSQGRTRLVQEVTLARGARVRFEWAVPVLATNETVSFRVEEDDRSLGHLGTLNAVGALPALDASVILVAAPSTPFVPVANAWARTPVAPTAGPTVTVRPPGGSPAAPVRIIGGRVVMGQTDLILPPARLPANWLGYTSVRAVVIDPDGWLALHDGQRAALRTWVAAGGDLVVVGGSPQALLGLSGAARENSPGVMVVSHLLGHVYGVRAEAVSSAGFEATLLALTPSRSAEWSLPVNRAADFSATTRSFRLPMAGVGEVRARSYLAILVLFAIVIGPVNYAFLKRRGRQALIVLTAPLVSAAFVALLGVYVIAAEGFGIHARVASLTLLDQTQQRAATRAVVSTYAAGRVPAGGLSFSRDTAVFPVVAAGMPELMDVDFTRGQQFTAGLLEPRTPASAEVVSVRQARERLIVRRTNTGLEVVNGLGAAVTSLVVRDAASAWTLMSPPLAEGGTAVLRAAGAWPSVLLSDSHPAFGRFSAIAREHRPGTYRAVLEHSPFIETGLEEPDERDSVHVVLGQLEAVP